MSSSEEIAAKVINEILKNDELKLKLAVALSSLLTSRKETNELLAEIKSLREETRSILIELTKLREDFNKRFEAHEREMAELRKETNRLREEMNRLREDFNKRFEAHEREMAELRKEMNRLREDFNKGMMELRIMINSLGARWGLMSEDAFRNALRGILEKRFNVKISRWETYDEKGIVFHTPSVIEIDIAIMNGVHTLIEIKSYVRKSDVATLLRKADLYKEKTGKKPELIIVTPFIEDNAKEFALSKKVTVYTSIYY